ncbi:MAG TPA: bis(5'-nucleosyl)-tetraphosphatase (symmetrical) YqeK [Clostridia bacterium]|jgi:predicted HD superfamily hydrolase involved in NAD metabolism|nr:bis(5'-nucleosyl)-tetraphosphatase (symmetrical) YqeK [Clostridia bacterium]HPY98919.1 bis(5'-nucleosyl)-tetraphosphatase (symmetrical) YqeK [Clostridia bacterium]HQC68869.1 bis(5'-nucleosyl)-tetraphosphatase (symmetrical) YqeK [Clostridia bacterium]
MGYISEEARLDIVKRYSPERYEHVKNVVELADHLARLHRADSEKVYAAALLHDIAKDMKTEDMAAIIEAAGIFIDKQYHTGNILHGPCAAVIAKKEYNIEDEEILNAIYYHSFGRAGMGLTEKIVFIADAAEKGRTYKNVTKIRKLMYNKLDEAVELSLDGTVYHVLSKGEVLYPVTAAALEYFKEQRIKD